METLKFEDQGIEEQRAKFVDKGQMAQQEAEADDTHDVGNGVTEIESLCMNCHENVSFMPQVQRFVAHVYSGHHEAASHSDSPLSGGSD